MIVAAIVPLFIDPSSSSQPRCIPRAQCYTLRRRCRSTAAVQICASNKGDLMSKATRIVLVFALVLAARPSDAQQTTGSIAGVVVDGQGAAVPGATVEARSSETGLTR